MLDYRNGVALAVEHLDKLHQRRRLVGVHAGRRLVEEEDHRVKGQCAGDFHLPLHAVGQVSGHGVFEIRQSDGLQNLQALLHRIFLVFFIPLGMKNRIRHVGLGLGVAADLYIVQNAHELEELQVLEGPRHLLPGNLVGSHLRDILPLEENFALGGRIHTGTHIEESGLTGSVGADDAENVALLDLHIHGFHSLQTAEILADAFCFQYGNFTHFASPPFFFSSFTLILPPASMELDAPMRPWGRTHIMKMMSSA